MKKIYCDICGEEMLPLWKVIVENESGRRCMSEYSAGEYDVCHKCINKVIEVLKEKV